MSSFHNLTILTPLLSLPFPPSLPAAIKDYREKLRDEDFPPTEQLRLRFKRTAFDIDITTVEEKGWHRNGASPADYFNYGFVEESWAVRLLSLFALLPPSLSPSTLSFPPVPRLAYFAFSFS